MLHTEPSRLVAVLSSSTDNISFNHVFDQVVKGNLSNPSQLLLCLCRVAEELLDFSRAEVLGFSLLISSDFALQY